MGRSSPRRSHVLRLFTEEAEDTVHFSVDSSFGLKGPLFQFEVLGGM